MFYLVYKNATVSVTALLLLTICSAALAENVTLRVGKTTATFPLPKSFKAYEAVSIPYKLKGVSGNIGVEAVSFEDVSRTKGKPVYDLAFPGSLRAKIDYVGMLRPDATPDKPETDQIVRVRVAPSGARRWFLFRIHNTGDTIWDTEGCGILFQFGVRPEGGSPWFAHVIHDRYVYPGESWDVWVPCDVKENTDFDIFFQLDWLGPNRVRLPAWTASARFRMGAGDTPLKEEDVPVKISEAVDLKHGLVDRFVTPKLLFDPMLYEAIPPVLTYKDHREFQSAYARPEKDGSGKLELMTAPWNKHVTLKLVTAEGIATKSVAIKPEISHLKLKANPKNQWVKMGSRKPLLVVKYMPQQSEWYLQPFLEWRMRDYLAMMKQFGVGAMAVMSIPVTPDDKTSEYYQQFTALLRAAREIKMPIIWWGGYMFDHGNYEKWSGLPLRDGGRGQGEWEVDLIEPNFPRAVVSMLDLFMAQNKDTSYVTADGKMPFIFDVPIGLAGYSNKQNGRRFGRFLTDLDKRIFRKWLEVRYIEIEHLNAKWKSAYASFEEVTPTEYAEGTPFEKLDSPGMIDWDDYCSELFTSQFGKIVDAVHAKYPNVMIGYLGEEGTRWGIELGDFPNSKHNVTGMRCEAFQTRDLLGRSKVDFAGSYTSANYPEEFRFSAELMALFGIAQFHIIRPMHSGGNLPPLFPIWKAQWETLGPATVYGYDPGGIAHLTETQYREMQFFTSLVPGR